MGNLHCTNTFGSYLCGCRQGYDTVIISDWDLMKRIPTCRDIDECKNESICPKKSLCRNSSGNYTCLCDDGFRGDSCQDIDECSIVSTCHANAKCTNSYGSYECSCNNGFYGDGESCKVGQCDDRRCPSNQRCILPTSNDCECKEGYSYDEKTKACQDTDECMLDHEVRGCDKNSVCTNTKGSYNCTCDWGYFGDGISCKKGSCTDDLCSLNEECISPRGIECRCKDGFERNDAQICVDTDECMQDICDENADCSNTDGSFECTCRQGFFGDGLSCFKGTCSDSNCPKNQKCVSPTTVDCDCMEGFKFDVFSACVDKDECQKEPCNKNAECINTEGTFNCSCNTGYIGDGFSCTDTDECADNVHDCSYDAQCINTKGSFTCSCDRGIGSNCTSEWILVLITQNPYGGEIPVPLIMNGKGDSKEIGFSFEDNTQVHGSCSVVWQGSMYIFGGLFLQRQISIVEKCKLTYKGELQFDMNFGACAQRENAEVFICFEHQSFQHYPQTDQNCHRAFGPLENFSKLPSSTYTHRKTRIAVSSGKPSSIKCRKIEN